MLGILWSIGYWEVNYKAGYFTNYTVAIWLSFYFIFKQQKYQNKNKSVPLKIKQPLKAWKLGYPAQCSIGYL